MIETQRDRQTQTEKDRHRHRETEREKHRHRETDRETKGVYAKRMVQVGA